MRKRIFIDLDNTVAATSQFEMEIVNNKFPYLFNKPFSKELLLSNSFEEMIRLEENNNFNKEERKKIISDIYSDENFWINIPVIKDSQAVIKEIMREDDVFFTTSTFDFGGEQKNYPGCLSGKIKWIKKNFPFVPIRNTIYCGHKWFLSGDWLIEDNPKQFGNVNDNSGLDRFNGSKILIDYPYNRNVNINQYRVNSWKDIDKLLVWHPLND